MACEELIFSEGAERAVKRALASHPLLWTLEDFVAQQGASWGFDEATRREAKRRADAFDRSTNCSRCIDTK